MTIDQLLAISLKALEDVGMFAELSFPRENFRKPKIVIGPDGEIKLQWDFSGAFISIEFCGDGTYAYHIRKPDYSSARHGEIKYTDTIVCDCELYQELPHEVMRYIRKG